METALTPEEFEKIMKTYSELSSKADRHELADKLVCDLLRALGYEDGVEIFEKMEKWYA